MMGGNIGNRLPQQVRRNPLGSRVNLSRFWNIHEVPFNEPSGVYTRRLEASFLTSYIVPPAPRNMQDEDAIAEFDPIIDSLFPTDLNFNGYALREFWQQYRPSQFRVYFLHPDGSIQILPNGNPRVYGGATFLNTEQGMEELRVSFASTLGDFVDRYQTEDVLDGDLQYVRLFIDLAPSLGGAAATGLPKSIPSDISPGIIWNPPGYGGCAFKCLAQAVRFQHKGLTWKQLKQQLQLEDLCPYTELFKVFTDKYPEFSVRLLSATGYLRFRLDGSMFEYEADTLRAAGGLSRQRNCIYLLLEDKHYFLVQLVCQFIRSVRNVTTAQFCHGCCLMFRTSEEWAEHACTEDKICDRCQMFFNNNIQRGSHKTCNPMSIERSACEYCGQAHFYSEECQVHHELHCPARQVATRLENYRIVNQATPKCLACGKRSKSPELLATHICYMEKSKLPDEPKFHEIYAFDFECMLLPGPANSKIHKINKVCVQLVGDATKRWAFDTADEFIDWIIEYFFSRPDVVVAMFAHNLKGYDGRLMLCEIYKAQYTKKSALVGSMIWTGMKINTFRWGNIVFRDSLLHIPAPLSMFPKIFGLEELQKGHFPYLFNTPENQNYVGPLPAIEYFEPQYKSTKDRSALLEWYNTQTSLGHQYDFKQVLHDYCVSDVDILARALEKYNEAGQLLNHELLPPLDRLTIASYTLNCWRTLHFPEDTIVNHTKLEEQRARSALRGGRTDVRCFYRKWTMEDVFVHGRYGKYVDVQSMYPYVMYARPVPVGKPRTIEAPQATNADILDYPDRLGFAEITINPPLQYTHHPAAVHVSDSGRLVGQLKQWEKKVFCLTEIRDLCADGWTIVKIFWIQYYDSRDDLFREYISKLVREKKHASESPPENFETVAAEWLERFNVKLEREKMVFNAGKRQIAKLQLNSLWGKLAERCKYEFCFNVDQEEFLYYENLEATGAIQFSYKMRISEDSWLVMGSRIKNPAYTKQEIENRLNTSVAIGSHVTMWGRRMLWEEMRRLQKRVLYHDTDSIIYAYDQANPYNTPTGTYLGDWEEELPGCAMIEFVALAPKTYSYRYIDMSKGIPIPPDASVDWFRQYKQYETWQGKLYVVKESIKVKGVKLHYDALQQINFDGLHDLFMKRKQKLQATQLQFVYDRTNFGRITTKFFQKDLIFQYEKGLMGLQDDPHSYPLGADNYWIEGFVQEGDLLRRRPRTTHEDDCTAE